LVSGTPIKVIIFMPLVIINMKSRMKGDFHVRFRGNAGVKVPCVTRLLAMLPDNFQRPNRLTKLFYTN
jgi:hypothetical protein